MSTWDLEEFLRASGWSELPAWNRDGHWPMWVLTEEVLRIICHGERDPKTKNFRGGHLHGALENGGGKKLHTEFPKSWTPDTIREAYYYLIKTKPTAQGDRLRFGGIYKGVEIEIEWNFDLSASPEKRVHMFPIRGKGVRAWKNGKLFKVGQKRRK